MLAQDSSAKALKLDHCIRFDSNLMSDDDSLDSAIEQLYQQIKVGLTCNRKNALKHIKIVLINLYRAYVQDQTLYVSYSRNKNDYRLYSRYNPAHYSYTLISVIDALAKHGFIESHLGFRTAAKSRLSRIKATHKLIKSCLSDINYNPNLISYRDDAELIILRDKNGDPVEYKGGPKIDEHRENLQRYNDLLARNELTINDDPIPLVEKRIYRVFNNSMWLDGGRFYGGKWMRMPHIERKLIKINGKPTVELDYSGLHIVLAYALAGVDYWTEINRDPYTLAGYEADPQMRNLFKRVSLILINAESEQSALKAVNNIIYLKNPDEWLWIRQREIPVKQMITSFKDMHPTLVEANYLSSGIGICLQGIDAFIAETIVTFFIEINQPVLCVHDSFVVPGDKAGFLHEAMAYAFKKATDNWHEGKSFTIRIK